MKKMLTAALCLLSLAGSQIVNAQENRRVRIVNQSSSTIRYFYASNVDRHGWEEDILGPMRVIAPGYYVNVNIDDGSGHCLYDLRAVLADNRQAVRYRFNVCTNSSWTVTD
jgi:hypothetical protein